MLSLRPDGTSLPISNGELAVAANVGTLVKPITRSQYQANSVTVPRNLFSHLDQQNEWQSSMLTGTSPTGWAGRAADIVAAQNSSKFPTFLSVAGNVLMGNGAAHPAGGFKSRRIA